jgi:hypothetical protein
LTIKYVAERVTVNAAQLANWHGSASAAALTLSGPCPECLVNSPHEVPRQFTARESGTAKPAAMMTADLKCACEEPHRDRPSTESTGCGRSWYVRATVAADGGVTLAPLQAALDPRLAVARKALDDAGPQQLTDLRGAAERWIGGVTALFSLFGLAGVTITRATVTGLSTWWQVGVAIAAATSIGLAGVAIWWIYRAAYGWPVTSPVSTDDEVLAWYEGRLAAPRTQAGYLRRGVGAAGLALTALVVTAGLLWFAPQQPAAGPLVQATLGDGSRVCGTLLAGPATGTTGVAEATGTVRIRRASDGTAVPVPVRSLASLSAVAAC